MTYVNKKVNNTNIMWDVHTKIMYMEYKETLLTGTQQMHASLVTYDTYIMTIMYNQ